MPLISTRTGASARGFSHMASSIFPGFNNNSTLAVAHDGSPYVTVYKFNDVTGFGTKYANPSSGFPTPAADAANSVDFINNASNPAQSIIIGLATSNDSLVGYRFDTTNGFGATKYTSNAPTTYIYSNGAVKSDGSVFAAGLLSSPYVVAVPWDVGFGTKYSDPATNPGGVVYGATFNPAGTVLLLQGSLYPYLHAYAWSSGFGTKYSDPATAPSIYTGTMKFHPSGNFFVSSSGGVWNWSSGFGTRYATPTGLSSAEGADWNPAGNIIAFADYDKLIAYDWSSGFGTKYTDAVNFGSGSSGTGGAFFSEGLAWNPTGTAVVAGNLISPYIYAYSWYNGWQQKYTNPSTLPTGTVNAVAFL